MSNVRSFLSCCVLVLALLAPLPVIAAPGSYTGEAPVNSQSDEERSEALKSALANVIAAQGADGAARAPADIAKAVEQAERYVLSYQYRRGSEGGAKYMLIAQFDGAAVNRILRRLGLGAAGVEEEAVDVPSEVSVWIGGINNANDYARVIAYLGHNNFVRNTQPLQARGDGVLVRLSLSASLARFLEAVGMERTLGIVNTGAKIDGVDAALALAP